MELSITTLENFASRLEKYRQQCVRNREQNNDQNMKLQNEKSIAIGELDKKASNAENEHNRILNGLNKIKDNKISAMEKKKKESISSTALKINELKTMYDEMQERFNMINRSDFGKHYNRLSEFPDIHPELSSIEKIYKANIGALISNINEYSPGPFLNGLLITLGYKRSLREFSELYHVVNKVNRFYHQERQQLEQQNKDNIDQFNKIIADSENEYAESVPRENQRYDNMLNNINNQKNEVEEKYKGEEASLAEHSRKIRKDSLESFTNEMLNTFKPDDLNKAYEYILDKEPNAENYTCATSNPLKIKLGTMQADISNLLSNSGIEGLLTNNYSRFVSNNKLQMPYMTDLSENMSMLLKTTMSNKDYAIDTLRYLIIKLFMVIPPGKVNFTFFDPVKLGESFAMFTRIGDLDDNTSKVINGKIWTAAKDIESRLQILTDTINNVTTRCLQGQYENIHLYNEQAGQNAEPYQILTIMDFPNNFTENSIRLLETIIDAGPKCGVYTVIVRSDEELDSCDDKIKNRIANIENKMTNYRVNKSSLTLENVSIVKSSLNVKIDPMYSPLQIDHIIPIIKQGIKDAGRIVIDYDYIMPDKNEDSARLLSIPIGLSGANKIHNMVLGEGISHHVLIAGQAGSGKSSLLHTIIMSALKKYDPHQLHIYLVDFKRGVEFKIYANYSIANFKVISVESEREFGYSVLQHMDKEQEKRANAFKRADVDNVDEFREKTNEDLPRILLIIDEFHELFSSSNDDLTKKSAVIMDRIIRQGRAFGIHVIMASQSVNQVGGLNKSVLDQMSIRIALKCPPADAKLILGEGSDAVNLISPDDPGQAVYNPNNGNKISNTIFRVAYLDGDQETELLEQIEKKCINYGFKSDTRVMLTNIEDNCNSIFNKFLRGEYVDFSRPKLYIGEALKIVNNMSVEFKQNSHSNILMMGRDEMMARDMFLFAIISLMCADFYKNKSAQPEYPYIYMVDFGHADEYYEKDLLKDFAKAMDRHIVYIEPQDVNEYMEKLFSMVTKRSKAANDAEPIYLFFFGLQRARGLRNKNMYKIDNDDYDDNYDYDAATPYEMLSKIITNGAKQNIHSIIWYDNFKTYSAHYMNLLDSFGMRIAFNIAPEDAVIFVDDSEVDKLSENNAIYYNEDTDNCKFRAYKKPDEAWLLKIRNRFKPFNN